jgi:cysteine-rich repeat protein
MGADSCSNCDPGTFSGIGASECTDCAAGSYSSEAAASECTGCSAGTYSGTGASVCSVCVAGTYSDPGASTCTSCPAGKFSGLGAGVCTPCSPGTFQDNAGSPSCDDCPPGTFELSTGASVCTDCPGGAETPCNGHGTCSDGPTGLGTCTCTSGYTGAACENNVGDTTTTTTTADTVTTSTLEPIGACCAGTGCFEISRNYCEGEFQGSYKGDASSCDEPLICSNCGDGCLQFGETCDDGDTANGDGCDSKCSQENCFSCSIGQPSSDRGVGCYGPSVCFATRGNRCTSVCGNGALEPGEECDDGNTAAGDCCAADCTSIGGDTLSPSCRWIVCAGSPDGDVRVRSGRGSTMNANACGDTAKLAGITSGSIVTTATIVSTAPTGEGIRFYGPPEVDGDIVTGGASVRANLYLTIPGTAVKTIDGGMTVAKDPLGMVDTTGSHALVSVCSADQAILAAAVTTLDGMASNLPDEGGANGLKVPAGGSHPIDVTGKGIAVVDMAALKLGHGATLTLKGGPTDVVMLVVNGRLKLGYHSAVVLDGLVPANVLFYGKGARCRLSPSVTGSGTVFCPEAGRYVIGVGSMWTGTFLGGAKEVQVRLGAHLTHAAFTGF